MCASSMILLRRAASKGVDGRSIELRQRVSDREPRRFRLHEDVSFGPKARVIVEHSGVQLDPRPFPRWIGDRGAASAAKGGAIGRGLVAERGFVPPNQLFALEQAEILAPCKQPGHKSRTTGFATSAAMAKLERPAALATSNRTPPQRQPPRIMMDLHLPPLRSAALSDHIRPSSTAPSPGQLPLRRRRPRKRQLLHGTSIAK
jgi:hypothetical protein